MVNSNLNERLVFSASELSQKEIYKLLIGTILPRPIAFVSTLSLDGKPNLAPYSFFNGVCSKPPTLLFCPMQRGVDGLKKDTLRNIEETKQFVVNVVTETIAEAMNITAGDYAPEISEFEMAKLTPVASEKILPPRVLESPINMECELNQIIYVGDGEVGSGSIVIGTVVCFHIHPKLYENGRIDTSILKPVGRLAGASYCKITESFEIQRPEILPNLKR